MSERERRNRKGGLEREVGCKEGGREKVTERQRDNDGGKDGS